MTRPVTMDDVQCVTDLLNTCSIEQTGQPRIQVGELKTDWEQPTFDIETDTLVVLAPGDKIVGHGALWSSAPWVRAFAAIDVHPDYRGRGIGTTIEKWAEMRSRRDLSRASNGTRFTLWQEALSTDRPTCQFLETKWYHVARHSLRMVIEMTSPPPPPAVPEGLIIRPFIRGKEEEALVWTVRDVFRDHWGFVERPFEEEYQGYIHFLENDPYADPTLWFVALDEAQDKIVAVSVCHPVMTEDPEMGWVMDLGVRRPWRRRGLALALLYHSFGALYRRGKRKVGLGVDAQSLTGATRLYEKAGMTVDRQYLLFEKELRPGEDIATRSLNGNCRRLRCTQ